MCSSLMVTQVPAKALLQHAATSGSCLEEYGISSYRINERNGWPPPQLHALGDVGYH